MEQLIGSLLEYIPTLVIVLLGILAVLVVTIKEICKISTPSWLTSRKKTKLAFINEQLEFGSLSPSMYNHLRHQRERLLLQISQGIDTDCFTAQAIMAVSKDMKPDGLYWVQLRSAAPYLRADSNGTLYVKIAKAIWIGANILRVICAITFPISLALLSFGFVLLFSNLVTKTQAIDFLVLGLVYLLFTGFLITLFAPVLAAQGVREQLKQMGYVSDDSEKQSIPTVTRKTEASGKIS